MKPDYTALDFPAPPPDRPYAVVCMVASADGKTVIEGDERGLGSEADRRLLHELRTHADVVLSGAGTMRATGASPRIRDAGLRALRRRRGKPPAPIGAVLTASGDLPLGAPFFASREFEAVVYLAEGAPPGRREAIAATGRPVVEVPRADAAAAAMRHMRTALGARLLLIEGGPTLNGECFRRGLVDELFLTIGAVVVGGDGLPTAVETPGVPAAIEASPRLELLHALPDAATGEVYLRYRVRR